MNYSPSALNVIYDYRGNKTTAEAAVCSFDQFAKHGPDKYLNLFLAAEVALESATKTISNPDELYDAAAERYTSLVTDGTPLTRSMAAVRLAQFPTYKGLYIDKILPDASVAAKSHKQTASAAHQLLLDSARRVGQNQPDPQAHELYDIPAMFSVLALAQWYALQAETTKIWWPIQAQLTDGIGSFPGRGDSLATCRNVEVYVKDNDDLPEVKYKVRAINTHKDFLSPEPNISVVVVEDAFVADGKDVNSKTIRDIKAAGQHTDEARRAKIRTEDKVRILLDIIDK